MLPSSRPNGSSPAASHNFAEYARSPRTLLPRTLAKHIDLMLRKIALVGDSIFHTATIHDAMFDATELLDVDDFAAEYRNHNLVVGT